jgi:hypothetical protein
MRSSLFFVTLVVLVGCAEDPANLVKSGRKLPDDNGQMRKEGDSPHPEIAQQGSVQRETDGGDSRVNPQLNASSSSTHELDSSSQRASEPNVVDGQDSARSTDLTPNKDQQASDSNAPEAARSDRDNPAGGSEAGAVQPSESVSSPAGSQTAAQQDNAGMQNSLAQSGDSHSVATTANASEVADKKTQAAMAGDNSAVGKEESIGTSTAQSESASVASSAATTTDAPGDNIRDMNEKAAAQDNGDNSTDVMATNSVDVGNSPDSNRPANTGGSSVSSADASRTADSGDPNASRSDASVAGSAPKQNTNDIKDAGNSNSVSESGSASTSVAKGNSDAAKPATMERPFLGVKNQKGASTATVGFLHKGSPADVAGLRLGDTIVAVNNQSVSQFPELVTELGKYRPGQVVKITFIRGGRRWYVLTRLAKRGAVK